MPWLDCVWQLDMAFLTNCTRLVVACAAAGVVVLLLYSHQDDILVASCFYSSHKIGSLHTLRHCSSTARYHTTFQNGRPHALLVPCRLPERKRRGSNEDRQATRSVRDLYRCRRKHQYPDATVRIQSIPPTPNAIVAAQQPSTQALLSHFQLHHRLRRVRKDAAFQRRD